MLMGDHRLLQRVWACVVPAKEAVANTVNVLLSAAAAVDTWVVARAKARSKDLIAVFFMVKDVKVCGNGVINL